MNRKKNIAMALLATCTLTVFLALTNPNQISLGLLAVPIVLVATIVYITSKLLLSTLKAFRSNLRLTRTLSMISSIFVTGLLVFQSVGGLTPSDIILLVGFGSVSVFYLARLL